MPFELQVIRATEFVRVGPQGRLDLKTSKKTLATLAQACRKRGVDRALLDRCRCRPSHCSHRRNWESWSGHFARRDSARANRWPCSTGATRTMAPERSRSSAGCAVGGCGPSKSLNRPWCGFRRRRRKSAPGPRGRGSRSSLDKVESANNRREKTEFELWRDHILKSCLPS